MEVLTIRARISWLLAAFCCATLSLPAQEFCAMTVDILQSDGTPARLIPVKLINAAGKAVFDERLERSPLRICDFGFGPHQLEVGYGFCYRTTISNIKLEYGEPIHLVVRLNECPADTIRGQGCDLFLRLRTEDGRPVVGAKVKQTERLLGTSDSFGRVMLYFVRQSDQTLSITADGVESKMLTVSCKGLQQHELVLTAAQSPSKPKAKPPPAEKPN